MGACKSCTQQPPELVTNSMERPGLKSETIRKIKSILDEFQTYQVVKYTRYQYQFDAVLKKGIVASTKTINSQGTVKPINLSQLKLANQELQQLISPTIDKSMKFKCGLELGDVFPQIKLHMLLEDPQQLQLPANTYTLIKSWGQGEQMVNFEHAIELVEQLSKRAQIKLIGLTRGNDEQQSVYEELVRSNAGWQGHKHIYVLSDDPDGHIFDIYFQEENNDVEEGYVASALLFYGENLIWKRYPYEWELGADSDEVAVEVTKLIESGIKNYNSTVAQNQQSAITRQEYLKLKTYIQSQQTPQPFTRNIEITLNKKVIYTKSEKRVTYEKPIFKIACSPKSQQITDVLAKPLGQPNLVWDSRLVKNLLAQKIKENNLNIEASLEKQIKIHINYEQNTIQIQNWEQAVLIPYYKSTQYIAQVKQWIHARDKILGETYQTQDPVLEKVNKMVLQFFQNIPTVEKVLNQEYGKIPYAEKRKPPYEEMTFSKSLGNEEITRRQDKILFLLLIDYENDDTLDMLKKLIQFKKDNHTPLQIAVLGHIRAESWTKLFQAFMEKHSFHKDAEEGVIETWFPVEDKIGSITFSAILSKMYGMVLEKRDCMLIDLDNKVRVIDSSRRVMPNLSKILTDLQTKNQILDKESVNYQTQYVGFKKCIRENPQLRDLTNKLKQQCKEDDCLIIYEQKKAKVWDFEGNNVQEAKKFQQPTKTLRIVPKTPEADEFTKTITKYVDNQDILQLK